jgi:hypothetical protein
MAAGSRRFPANLGQDLTAKGLKPYDAAIFAAQPETITTEGAALFLHPGLPAIALAKCRVDVGSHRLDAGGSLLAVDAIEILIAPAAVTLGEAAGASVRSAAGGDVVGGGTVEAAGAPQASGAQWARSRRTETAPAGGCSSACARAKTGEPSRMRAAPWTVILLVCVALAACHHERPERVPGETDIVVTSVSIESATGEQLRVPHGDLFVLLGLRTGNVLVTHRYFNEFRLAEDRRRLQSWWQDQGHFDVAVSEPALDFAPDGKSVAVRWKVREGAAYRIGSVALKNVPKGYEDALAGYVSFGPGDRVDLEGYRYLRHRMAWHLQRDGWGHAMVYSRAFVDRDDKLVHWTYWVDTGPKTRIGEVQVEGAHKVPAEKALERAGIAPGKPYSLDLKESIELDLLDTGAYASVVVKPTNLQIDRVIPGERPDTGGVLADDQVDAQGNLVPRKLPEEAEFRLVLVEAPATQLRLRAGAEADPTRGDLYAGASLWNRNLFGPYQHLVLEGRAGYGFLWSGDEDESSGAYGDALARYVGAGMLGRLVDFRLTARYRDVLFPGSRLREVAGGPGLRAKLAQKLFLDLDALYRFEKDIGYGPFDPATRDAFRLPEADTAHGAALDLALVWDARNDRVEPTAGHLLALRSGLSPGSGLGTHRYALIAPEARGFVPLSANAALGARAAYSVVVGEAETGVPLGGRLFGGGAYGMRGFGRDRLSPEAPCASDCDSELTGGLSLLEASLEARFLPFRKFFGFVGFVDTGGAGALRNPLEEGVSVAVGLGPRLRLWYVPIALDAAYRLIGEGEFESATSLDSYLVFLRIGEAF